MFEQLPYFQTLRQDIAQLEDKASNLNALLSQAYSPPTQVYCSLKDQIESILAEESQLQDVIAVISQQVDNCTFVPSSIDSHQLSSLNATRSLLPEWFPHVFEKEYAAYKRELDQYASQLLKLHGLAQKRNTLSEEKNNLELLYRRFLSLTQFEKHPQSSSEINIMEDVAHLKSRIQHTRKSFQYFCQQVAEKIGQFVHQIANKSRNFSVGNLAKPNYVGQSRREEVTVEPLPVQTRSYNHQYSPRQHKSVRFEQHYHSPSVHRNSPNPHVDFETKVQRQFQKLDEYRGVRSDYKVAQRDEVFPSPRAESKMTSFKEEFSYQPIGSAIRRYEPIAVKLNSEHNNCNHHMHEHTHTCQRGRSQHNWFGSVKSADKSDSHYYQQSWRFKSPVKKYDYKRQLQSNSMLNDYYA